MNTSFENLSSDNKKLLQLARSDIACAGVELTPTQLIDTMVSLDEKINRITDGAYDIISFRNVVAFYSDTPPKPPYKGHFDICQEAISFKQRAEKTYPGLKLKLQKHKTKRLWRLV